MQLDVKRQAAILKPDQTRVLLRPFVPGDAQRIGGIVNRIAALPEDRVGPLLNEVSAGFSQRHERIQDAFLERFEKIRAVTPVDNQISDQRKLLIGSYFLAEYSLESAALFNPSIVPHPNQDGIPTGALRFILSLRATGEGHISSITFRTGLIHADNRIEIDHASGFLSEPRQVPNPLYDKASFARKLFEVGVAGAFTGRVLNTLGDWFSLKELSTSLELDPALEENREAAQGMRMIALSNYEVQFQPDQPISARIIFPATPSQRNGIEDARFTRFTNDDGSFVYYATFTAFDGRVIMPELVETTDFLLFRFITLNGPAAENKGMALFPRKINGCYVMLSRQDNENIYLMSSADVYFWHERKLLLRPVFPWELVQIGNCGPPIETEAGWLVLSHGVGPMRTYCIGAFLLDLDDPSKVIGRLREPLLKANANEREGYVPNVLYTCGALVHNGELIIPYAWADHASGFATVPLNDVLAALSE